MNENSKFNESKWSYQNKYNKSTYEFFNLKSKIDDNLNDWIAIGKIYKIHKPIKIKSAVINSILKNERFEKRGFYGYLSRVSNNINLITDPSKINNIFEIGPGWGSLRLYSEELNIKNYTCLEPIQKTRDIFKKLVEKLERNNSSIKTKIIKKLEPLLKNQNSNTLYYAANVLSEISSADLQQYIYFIKKNLETDDYFIIEDWFYIDRKYELLNLISNNFYVDNLKVNYFNYHLSILCNSKKITIISKTYIKIKLIFILNFIFPVKKIMGKIKRIIKL